ncbi:Surface antigen [Mesonia phycicola]|uniref:Surface antigen n=1 Tax=Mesonia phycicola TaxID=579105 RepID=A0A1M6AZ04_9FLAO|nr:BamA/TamA family outer membrane protein [Mesonia phycicola]SHI41661.1 Surface antigen [Mesonia phycicola]
MEIEYKNSGEDYSLFKAQATLPFIFNTPLNIETSISLTKQDSTFIKNKQTAGLSFWATTKTKASINYQTETSNYLLTQNTTDITNYQDYEKKSINTEILYTKKSSITLFKNQTSIKAAISVSEREIENKTTKQQEISLEFEKNFKLNNRSHIYIANQSKILLSKNYLDNELYWIGGINSIRGFEENSLTSNKYAIFNTEYRYILDNNLYTNTVFDFGRIENENQNQKNNVYAIGFGLGLKTKNGLLKLIFANGKTNNQNFDFNNTKAHLSLTTIF